MRNILFLTSLLAALVIAPVAHAADNTLLVITKSDRPEPQKMQMTDAAACASAQASLQTFYNSMTAAGWPVVATVKCL